MMRGIPVAAFVVALVASFAWGITQAQRSLAAQQPAHEQPAPLMPPLPGFTAADRPEIQVLLSSVDTTVSFPAISNG